MSDDIQPVPPPQLPAEIISSMAAGLRDLGLNREAECLEFWTSMNGAPLPQ